MKNLFYIILNIRRSSGGSQASHREDMQKQKCSFFQDHSTETLKTIYKDEVRDMIEKWTEENTEGYYIIWSDGASFELEEDAMAFKLRWN